MATYKATSWGRTRRPKHLKEQIPPAKQAATFVTVVTSGNLKAGLNDTNAGENGYATENQRYLHVLIKDDSGIKTIDIYGYCYAFGEWAPLMLPLGNATFTKASASSASGGAVQQYIFEIAGVDRIAFVETATGAPVVSASGDEPVRAACSTF